VQGVDGKAGGKEAAGKDDKAVRLKADGRGVGKAPPAAADVEVWHDKNAVKRLQAVRLRGALLDAGLFRCWPACRPPASRLPLRRCASPLSPALATLSPAASPAAYGGDMRAVALAAPALAPCAC
jgi:hypothetical protein